MLEVQKISKYFGGLGALKEVSIKVVEGEFVGLIGPNGSGKTTFFNVVSGVLKSSSGRIIFLGQDITGFTPDKVCRAGLTRTFQIPKPFKSMSIIENAMAGIFFSGRYPGYSEQMARQEAYRLLEFTGLNIKPLAMPGELTVIDLRRLELVRALATKPKLILLDEVVSGLNAEEIVEASSVLKRINSELGLTIIWVEHIIHALMNLVNRVYVLDYGEVICEGKPAEVARDERVCEAYLGKQ